MTRTDLWTQLLLIGLAAAVDQTCIWKDGSRAIDYAPCPNSTASTGNCCSIGDVCTANGMCYGGVGLIYRGACINEWGGSCLTYCEDVSDTWANFYPCPYAGSGSRDGPEKWWCGTPGTTLCEASNSTAHLVVMAPSVGVKLLTASSPTSSATASATPGSSNSSSCDNKATLPATSSNSGHNAAMIGLGVVLGVVIVIAAAAGFWAFRAMRKQRAQFAAISARESQEYYTPNIKDSITTQPVYRPEQQGHLPSEIHSEIRPAELDGRHG